MEKEARNDERQNPDAPMDGILSREHETVGAHPVRDNPIERDATTVAHKVGSYRGAPLLFSSCS